MSRYHVRPLRADECEAIADWRYDGRCATYDFEGGAPDPADGFFAVADDDGRLVGYCCFGPEARVPGVDAEDGVLDVGYGMRPDLVGEGRGRGFVEAILSFGERRFSPRRLRALVLDWNARSRAACRNAGFEQTGEVTSDERRFVVFERPVASDR